MSAGPVHDGCLYPPGMRCRGNDRCQFPSRCVRATHHVNSELASIGPLMTTDEDDDVRRQLLEESEDE